MNDETDTWDAKAWLRGVLDEFGCDTGTLHWADAAGEWLDLETQIGVPDELMPMIRRIPVGKGIAGAAAARREPVEICNLQQDLGGVAQPDARKTGVSGSLAVPVFAADGCVLGTLGIGKHEPHAFSDAEKERLSGLGQQIAGHLSR